MVTVIYYHVLWPTDKIQPPDLINPMHPKNHDSDIWRDFVWTGIYGIVGSCGKEYIVWTGIYGIIMSYGMEYHFLFEKSIDETL